MSAMWRDGVHFETADKAFRFTVGGRVDFDSTWYSASDALTNSIGQFNNFADPNLGLADGAEFRRARLRFQGTLWEVMEFNTRVRLRQRHRPAAPHPGHRPAGRRARRIADLEPAPGVRLTDLWLGFNQLPDPGHRSGPATRRNGSPSPTPPAAGSSPSSSGRCSTTPSTTTSSSATASPCSGTFSTSASTPGRASSASTAAPAPSTPATASTPATSGSPACPSGTRTDDLWVHLGVDYSYRTLHLDQTRFRARPLVQSGIGFQVPNILNTGILFSRDSQQVVNFEFASGLGPDHARLRVRPVLGARRLHRRPAAVQRARARHGQVAPGPTWPRAGTSRHCTS